jgi:hypothetical protein
MPGAFTEVRGTRYGPALERLQTELSGYSCTAGISVYPLGQLRAIALIDLARIRSRQRQMQTAA